MVLSTVTAILDWFGVIVFAITGALVASRKQMDLVGFALLGTVTGIGGGTIRDVVLGLLPVFWVREPAYLVTCVLVSCLVFFPAPYGDLQVRAHPAVALQVSALAGRDRAGPVRGLNEAGSIAAIAMGVITATFGGMVRDVLGGESPVILAREIYVSAALLGASSFILFIGIGVPHDGALISGFMVVLLVRGAALHWAWSLPATGRDPDARRNFLLSDRLSACCACGSGRFGGCSIAM
jgi:uncharacterized membrane protein YeiH